MVDKRMSRYKEGVHIQKCACTAWAGKGFRAWACTAEEGDEGDAVLNGSPTWAHCLKINTALPQTEENQHPGTKNCWDLCGQLPLDSSTLRHFKDVTQKVLGNQALSSIHWGGELPICLDPNEQEKPRLGHGNGLKE